MGPKSRWGGPVGIGYVRPVQFLDHLTVIIRSLVQHLFAMFARLGFDQFELEDGTDVRNG